MLKLPDNLSISAGVNPVDRALQVLAVEKIASPLQELQARATQFVKGQEYLAQVMSKVNDKTYLVKVDNALLKMDLGNAARAGQTMLLRYMQDSPVPTFFLAPNQQKTVDNATQLSQAATLLGRYLQEAQNAGVSSRIIAGAVVTQMPTNPQIVAQDLRRAISGSGLFYESHLSEFVQGQRQLASVMQEPQNQSGTQIAQLMAQQLASMENQRIAWHGEVWPGQKMDWDVELHDKNSSGEAQQDDQADDARPVSSEITLHLPNLGKVTARLNIADARMRIQILAEQGATMQILKTEASSLTQAIADSGLQLDVLTVERDE
jgi:hypothetical protein